ncbi:HNH endonuclease [Flavobacterium aciduliphilum]|uniref:Putative restriction endonuclease n=1 Tax=Flavobacterium aciduliphilum TaxID=1101402 RepID=A0A328YTN0_9FLAO|nr:HNH endonuclease [Flavobacterium aciduliphilum]RAR75552.1 putative restriction endonuclease [Flavobacterium aciduliphilum]
MATRNLWTREELILAFNLYLKIPFSKIGSRNKDIIHLANIMGRTPNSIALRLVNFASVDPILKARGIKGMSGGTKIVQPIWDEFYNNQEALVFQSEQILAQKENTSIENKYQDILFDLKDLKGETAIREVKTRVNQSVFRQMVLANYSSKCAITGIDIPQLLFASHIVPWSVNEKERLNPENGICLSPLYDKAFDKGLIGINTNYQIILSKELKTKKETAFYSNHFASVENQKITEPLSYFPRKEFLEYHMDVIFEK